MDGRRAERIRCWSCGHSFVPCTNSRARGPRQQSAEIPCPACAEPMLAENVRIRRDSCAVVIRTGGGVVIGRGACVAAARICAGGDVTVRGGVRADIHARGAVRVTRTGLVEGDVRASGVTVEPGGRLESRSAGVAPAAPEPGIGMLRRIAARLAQGVSPDASRPPAGDSRTAS